MVEMAFKVNPGSEFYKNYFSTKEEKAHFVEIAKQFFDKYFPGEKFSYVLNDRLTVELTPELLAKYESQVMKRRDPHGFVIFKKTWQGFSLIHVGEELPHISGCTNMRTT